MNEDIKTYIANLIIVIGYLALLSGATYAAYEIKKIEITKQECKQS